MGGCKRWGQVDGGMQPGVRQLVFANHTAHLAALYDGWSPILCVRTGPVRAGSQRSSSWSFHLLQQTLFLLSFLCSFLSNGSVQFPPCLAFCLACFLTLSLARAPGHPSFCLFHFHFQHLPRLTTKSVGWPKSGKHLTKQASKLVSNKSDLSSFTKKYNFIQTYLTHGRIHLGHMLLHSEHVTNEEVIVKLRQT